MHRKRYFADPALRIFSCDGIALDRKADPGCHQGLRNSPQPVISLLLIVVICAVDLSAAAPVLRRVVCICLEAFGDRSSTTVEKHIPFVRLNEAPAGNHVAGTRHGRFILFEILVLGL